MTFITTWKVREGKMVEAVERFLGTGDPKPDGVKSVGRWHRADMQGGVHVLEADSPQALVEYTSTWVDLLEIECTPAVGDAEASLAYSKIAGVKLQGKTQSAIS
jgi:hypothetical protein